MLDNFFFIILPYAALSFAIVVTLQRYFKRGFTYSSLSSQFLESDELFYGSVPWHIGILVVLAGHVIGFAIPRQVLWFNGVPARLYVLETTGLLFGLLALVGIVSLIVRRLSFAADSRGHVVDGCGRAACPPCSGSAGSIHRIDVSLGLSVVRDFGRAVSAFAVLLQPDLTMIAPLPLAVKAHIINAYVFLAILPFSRLVHMLVVPIHYLWRPYQLVIWNWDRRRHRRYAPTATQPVAAREPAVTEKVPAGEPITAR